jgi:hypothetical protein
MALPAVVAALLPTVNDLIDRFIPNASEAAKARVEMEKALIEAIAQQNIAQTEVNKIEAASSSLFVAGWRPFIGWVCGIAFAYHFIALPVLLFVAALSGEKIDAPLFDMDALFTVLMGMLGLGGLRTFEKFKGVANK